MIDAARRVVADLFGPLEGREFAVRYWDGTTDTPPGAGELTLEIARPSAVAFAHAGPVPRSISVTPFPSAVMRYTLSSQ